MAPIGVSPRPAGGVATPKKRDRGTSPRSSARKSWPSGVAIFAALLGLSFVGNVSPALSQLTVTGQVTDEEQAPLAGARVTVRAADTETVTDASGRYRLVIPESRLSGASAELRVQELGYRGASTTIQLEPGQIEQNFVLDFDPLEVEKIVARGQGLEVRRAALAVTVNSVSAEEITATQETNLVSALTGKAPNVEVWTSSGEPGAGAFIRIRGSSSLLAAQPLFVVDGVPISNASTEIQFSQEGTVESNRAIDLNPEDIESIEILKGPAAAIYGSRAAQGVVLITTKRGTPGDTRVMLKMSITRDEVTELHDLQSTHGRGLDGAPLGQPGVNIAPTLFTSWGPPLAPGTQTFDHAREIYEIGHTYDTDLQVSGGNESTTYFLSVSRLDQSGVIKGNSEFERTTVRIKGSHSIANDLRVAGNVSYAQSNGDFIQKGNTISGIQLGALRTPPEFNNIPHLDPATGLHRSFRCNPDQCNGEFTDPHTSRGYDNPFWIAFEMPNTSEVQRVFGNLEVQYRPIDWLNLTYTLGSDFWSDDRRSLFPKSSSVFPQGRLIRAGLKEWIVDSNLLATVSGEVTENISGSLTLGQNLNHHEFERFQVNSFNQIAGTDLLDFSIDREPNEFGSEVRTDGIFAQANVELWDQLFVSGGVRGDKASTFGEEQRFWYSSGSLAWEFTAHPMFSALRGAGEAQADGPLSFLNFGKIRLAYGEAGTHPPVFSNVNAFTTGTIGPVISTIYAGFDGVISEGTLGNPDIVPERSKEWEVGFELAMLDNRLALDVVRYDKRTEEAILSVPVPMSTGFFSQFRNGAEFDNKGWEIQLDGRLIQTSNFAWDVRAQWATDESCVKELLGTESVFLTGFNFAQVALVQPRDVDGDGTPDEEGCFPFGVHRGADFVRFGRGLAVGGVNIDEAFPDAPEGAIYIAEDGLPRFDSQPRVLGDPNPEWTGSLRNTVTLFNRVRLSALVDFVQGFERWNGTKGVLFFFGTHADTGPCHGEGCHYPSFQDYYRQVLNIDDETFAGPGAGTEVTLNWANWFLSGIGSAFTGPQTQFIEDASFVKLRDVSASYTFDHPWIWDAIGFSSIDVKVSGRNLATWTDYGGIDPEAELGDQILGRGLDYFNNPFARSLVLTLQLNR